MVSHRMRGRPWRAIGGGILLALLVPLVLPAFAAAHAQLESSSPGRGERLERAPQRVELRFNEPVEIAFGSVRVYDRDGERVDSGPTAHVRGRAEEVTIDLEAGLGDGVYTATYRVVSADSHPVAGGFTFTVGSAGAAPSVTVDQLIGDRDAGDVTEAAFGAARALAYMAIALAAGGFVFAAAVWRPALHEVGGAGPDWLRASEAFARRTREVGIAAAGVGIATSALGIGLQGATAGGTSLWSALDPGVVGDVLGTRFGTVWSLRLLAWLALASLLAVPAARLHPAQLRPASLGATGLAPAAPARPVGVAAAAALLAFLCLSPALAGHASTLDPAPLLVPADGLHVAAMATWVGGIGVLLLALPAATRLLAPPDRTRLLAAVVARFSPLALFAVAVLVASGLVQAIPELESLSDLVRTAFGRALLAKIVLLLCLVALGAWNRQRARPRLASLAASGAAPGREGWLLRRALRGEAALMISVLGVTAALVAYAPPGGGEPGGPFTTRADLGPAEMGLVVDPARPGANEIHLDLFDRDTGRPYSRTRELELQARLPEKDIGPIQLPTEKAGPGHYVVRGAHIAPSGDWTLVVGVRVSEFDVFEKRIGIPIE